MLGWRSSARSDELGYRLLEPPEASLAGAQFDSELLPPTWFRRTEQNRASAPIPELQNLVRAREIAHSAFDLLDGGATSRVGKLGATVDQFIAFAAADRCPRYPLTEAKRFENLVGHSELPSFDPRRQSNTCIRRQPILWISPFRTSALHGDS